MKGFGTEKIEDEIGTLFPEIKTGRLDLDKSRSRKAFEKVISDFETGKVQALIGTQMVTKGLDFENVQLVGIIDADGMLNFPDFRAFERSYQLMVQVSGRAGRRKERGRVIIQTIDPSHPVIRHVLKGEFDTFINDQLSERSLFKYPPFVRLIRLTLRHEIPSILEAGSVFLKNELKEVFGGRVLGPQPPPVAKTHGKHIRQIIIKIEKDISVKKAKQMVAANLDLFRGNSVYRQIRVNLDVDPM
ncbi:MAG TPA: helicase-related protein, partial [Bacteroidales bacterium]|nr:helicase-related protein [Bacteroidales bacterium]